MPDLRFVVSDAAGTVVDPVLPESLRPFLTERAGDPGQCVELVGSDAGRVVRAVVSHPADDGSWSVRLDLGDDPLVARAPNTDAVFDLLRSWAADDGWWREAFGWQRA